MKTQIAAEVSSAMTRVKSASQACHTPLLVSLVEILVTLTHQNLLLNQKKME